MSRQLYDLVLADPPWRYDRRAKLTGDLNYSTMSMGELKAMDVGRITSKGWFKSREIEQ